MNKTTLLILAAVGLYLLSRKKGSSSIIVDDPQGSFASDPVRPIKQKPDEAQGFFLPTTGTNAGATLKPVEGWQEVRANTKTRGNLGAVKTW